MFSLDLHVIIMSNTFSLGNYQPGYRHLLNSPLVPSLVGCTRQIPQISSKTQIVLCLPCVPYSRTAETSYHWNPSPLTASLLPVMVTMGATLVPVPRKWG